MKKKNFKIGLFGKCYKDNIFTISKFKKGETNIPVSSVSQRGGIYNIDRLKIPGIKTKTFDEGKVNSIIINELDSSKRSSILHNSSTFENKDTSWKSNYDWIHIAYVDDIDPVYLNDFSHENVSVDFCTLNPRKKYRSIIDECSLVFDSRERKPLYSDIKTSTPLILHDEYGCECIKNGKITYFSTIKPVKGLEVNGAGDIFCGIFLSQLYNLNLEEAVKTSCQKTTDYLKVKYEKI
jgi:hypothetical protein